MRKLLAAAMIGVLGLTPAIAADESESDDQKVICKREKETGSNLAAKRICMTRAQWEEVRKHSKRELRGLSDRAFNPTPIPGAVGRSPTPGN